MKLSANTYCYRDLDRESVFRSLAGLGFQGVEIIAHPPCWHADTLDTDEVREASLRLLDELKLEVVAISPHTEFLLFDQDRRRQMIEHCMAMIDLTLLYGVKIVRIFSGGEIPEGKNRQQCIDEVLKGMIPCVEYAEKKGVKLAVESHGKFGNDLEALVAILDKVDSSALGVTLDTANFAYHDVDPLHAIDVLKDRIYHTHLKDAMFGAERYGTPIGEGSLDFPAIMSKLKDTGYKGAYCIEYGGRVPAEEGLRRGAEYLRKLGAKLGL